MKFLRTLIMLLFTVSLFDITTIHANETDAVSFSVQAVLPENQVESMATYFDIEVTPEQEQELEVILTNQGDTPIKVAISLNQAATNSNGVITYDDSQENHQADLDYPINEIAKLSSDIVTIPANSQDSVMISLVAPEEAFDGQILSGLHFSLLDDEDNLAEGMSIRNLYAYVIGLNITSKDSSEEVEPELKLMNVELTEINHRDGLQTTFQNTAAVMVSKLNFEGSIFLEGEENPVYTRVVERFSIAPNNQFNFPITFDNGRLESGKYIFKAKLMNDDYQWKFEENFEVNAEEQN